MLIIISLFLEQSDRLPMQSATKYVCLTVALLAAHSEAVKLELMAQADAQATWSLGGGDFDNAINQIQEVAYEPI